MTHKGEKYSVKLKKYYFCNGTFNIITIFILNYRHICHRFFFETGAYVFLTIFLHLITRLSIVNMQFS